MGGLSIPSHQSYSLKYISQRGAGGVIFPMISRGLGTSYVMAKKHLHGESLKWISFFFLGDRHGV